VPALGTQLAAGMRDDKRGLPGLFIEFIRVLDYNSQSHNACAME